MTSNLDEKGLRSIFDKYDVFFIDIWGVLHNGLNLFKNSVEVLEKLEKNKKKRIKPKYFSSSSQETPGFVVVFFAVVGLLFVTLYSINGISGFFAGGFLSKFSINFFNCVISNNVGTFVLPGCLSHPSRCQKPFA